MRNDDGTTPLASPLWTPSVRMSTRRSPPTSPRSEVVTHSRSWSKHPESRHSTSVGDPMRPAKAARYAGRSGLPLSSLASIRMIRRECGVPASCAASIASSDAKAA